MRALFEVIDIALSLYMWIVVAMAIFSWLVAFNVVNTRNQVVAMIGDFLYRITEPALRPIRNFMPNLGGIDISPVILFPDHHLHSARDRALHHPQRLLSAMAWRRLRTTAAKLHGAAVTLDMRAQGCVKRGCANGNDARYQHRKRDSMSAKIIDGKAIAADLRAKLATETRRLTAAHGLVPGLAVILVGDNAASRTYVASKARALVETGMKPFDHYLPADTSETALLGR